ncbi:hypothetical protein Mgra_00000990 [Meloidogyne graminicola]|uniref:Uncharacterized protein n=1 Tax=Meloidogyne graminicola TaxID=189291 RepID=A0A8T0A0U5_9BILA|nr:hypothetical protein Mgra_00000990 [Meloidogyne graminicola]
MQQQNGTTIPNFQQTLNNNISYSQLQQQQQHQYFNNNINNTSLNNSETFYQLQQQQQLYQSQQIPTSELKEIQQQQQQLNNIEQQFVTNNENIKKRGPGPGRPPKNKIDNAKRDDSAGCSNVYEYNNMKPDEMQMLSLETKSATLMDGRTTIQPNLSTVQFPYGDASSNACFANQINFDVSSLPTCPQDYNNIGVTWTGHQSAGYGITSNQLGFTEIDLGLYANTNGLMALPGQLQYELDPMLATAYGVWPAVNGYYMGTETGKLLTTDGSSIHVSQQPSSQQYMATASTSNNYTGDNAQSTTTTTFYGAPPPPSLQNILPSSIDQTNVFHTGISTLPPPPSQLATADQLYGLQNGHQNGVFGQLTSIDSSLPTCNILPISNNTKPETPNTPITLLNLEQQQCSSSNVNQFIIQQQEQQNQLLFVGNTNEQNIQKIETNLNSSTILPLKEIPTTLSLISAPQIETISSTTTTFGRKYKSKKNNSKNMFSRQSTSRGLFIQKYWK